MHPDWHSKKFWMTLAGQAVALAAVLGIVRQSDVAGLGDTLHRALGAVFCVLANAWVLIHYIKSGYLEAEAGVVYPTDTGALPPSANGAPKPPAPPGPTALPVLLLASLLGLLLAGGAAPAQQYVPATARNARTPQVRKVFALGIVAINRPACRPGQQQQAAPAPQTDPAVFALLQQLSNQQQSLSSQQQSLAGQNTQILALLAQVQAHLASGSHPGPSTPPAPSPSPAPAPQVIVLPSSPGGGSGSGSGQPQLIVLAAPNVPGALQQLPIAGQPLQVLPIAGSPLQQLPIAGAPLQQLPIAGQPLQVLPQQGTPRQQLPVAPQVPSLPLAAPANPQAPPQALPVAPVVPQQSLPAAPGAAPQQTLPQSLPNAQPLPAGFQRYTVYLVYTVPARR